MTAVRRLPPVSIVLALLMGAVPMLPVEHAHEADLDGHHEVLVHRHSELHLPGHDDHRDDHHQDQAGRVLDHDDDHTITLSSSFIAPSPHVSAAPVRSVVAILEPPPMVVNPGPTAYVERLIHGPPRAPTGLRAPPSSSRL
jgi:hypothetical protein